MEFWLVFWATTCGAIVGAAISAWFADRVAKRQDAREQIRFEDMRAETKRFADEERAALYRERLDTQLETVTNAMKDYETKVRGDYTREDCEASWRAYIGAVDRAAAHARDQDQTVLRALLHYSLVPGRPGEAMWMRLSKFMELTGQWRRGETNLNNVIAGFERNSGDAAPDR
ncbi:hypothetical protein ACSBPH_08430 [Microbacterium sp. F51-2R]|uniref:hypothetical protein n=1 Tax=Microbacterium sp. F51-2R TaxID=3445777 RepID=UPI003F9F7229